MKHFFGTVKGSGGTSTNSGTMSSGLRVEAHSRQGSVVIQLSESAGIDHAKVYLTPHPTTRKGTERVLYDGPVAGTEIPDVVMRLPSRATRQVILPDPGMLSDPELLIEPEFIGGNVVHSPLFVPSSAGKTNEQIDAEVTTFIAEHSVSILPPAQRRTQPGYSYRPGVVDPARLLTGPIFGPAGNELADDHQDYDCNEGYEAEPRRPRGKLTLLRSVDD